MKISFGKAQKKIVKANTKSFGRSIGQIWKQAPLSLIEMKRVIDTGRVDNTQTLFMRESLSNSIPRATAVNLERSGKAIRSLVRTKLLRKYKNLEKVDIGKIVNSSTKLLSKRLAKQQIGSMRLVSKYGGRNTKMLNDAAGLTIRQTKALIRAHKKTTIEKSARVANREFSRKAFVYKRARIKAISRTETSKILNLVSKKQIELIKKSGGKGVRVWNAQLDHCPICDALEGTTVKIGESFEEEPPIHVNCNCFIVSMLKK